MSSGSRPNHWTERIEACAFAYRGYNVTNLGKSPELLAHPAYGPVVKESLEEASAICAAATGRAVDLVRRVRERAPTTLVSFAEDTATVVGMELAQLRLLERFFGVRINQARLSFGYSIGELSALVAGGVYPLDQLLAVPLRLADD
jgi:[acyl-carrier-protein] S-malonyltransferase